MVQLLLWLLGGYVLLGASAYLGQGYLVYPAPQTNGEPNVPGATLQRIAAGDHEVFALYCPPPPGAPVVVHFHGNGETLGHQAFVMQALAEHGLGSFAVEYPGYGLARGQKPSEPAIYAHAEAALQHLMTTLGVQKGRIVLQGQSLGSAVAIEMASRGYGSRLVLISPFTSLAEVARRVFPVLPISMLLRDRYASLSKAQAVRVPVLIAHGDRDTLIPLEMGQRLATALSAARLYVVKGAGHNDVLRPEVVREIASFVREEE